VRASLQGPFGVGAFHFGDFGGRTASDWPADTHGRSAHRLEANLSRSTRGGRIEHRAYRGYVAFLSFPLPDTGCSDDQLLVWRSAVALLVGRTEVCGPVIGMIEVPWRSGQNQPTASSTGNFALLHSPFPGSPKALVGRSVAATVGAGFGCHPDLKSIGEGNRLVVGRLATWPPWADPPSWPGLLSPRCRRSAANRWAVGIPRAVVCSRPADSGRGAGIPPPGDSPASCHHQLE
jgi:hypothetical protein